MPPLELHLPSLAAPYCARALPLEQEGTLLVQEGITLAGVRVCVFVGGTVLLCVCVCACVCVCDRLSVLIFV
jgi:hypothetical protein